MTMTMTMTIKRANKKEDYFYQSNIGIQKDYKNLLSCCLLREPSIIYASAETLSNVVSGDFDFCLILLKILSSSRLRKADMFLFLWSCLSIKIVFSFVINVSYIKMHPLGPMIWSFHQSQKLLYNWKFPSVKSSLSAINAYLLIYQIPIGHHANQPPCPPPQTLSPIINSSEYLLPL